MRPVSSKFLAAVKESHRMAARARILPPGYNGTTPPTGTPVPIESGSVTFDANSQIQANVSLDTSINWPVNYQDAATPYGNELFIERGVVYGDGSTEWVSLGYYRINSVEQQSAPNGALSISGQDRMSGIIDAKLLSPVTFGAGTSILAMIESLVTAVYPWAVFDYDASLASSTINVAQTTTDDRYRFLDDLITSYGMIWYWDYRGILYIHYPPPLASPVITIKSGSHGVIVAMSRTLDRGSLFNGCVAQGQQASNDTPPIAIVVDTNPNSPTYWYGQFGQVPQFITSSMLTSVDQCITAATSSLLKSTGLPYEVDFGMVPNPAIALWDPVTVSYNNQANVESHIIKQMVVGLRATDSMTAQTRQLVNGQFVVIG